MRIQCGRRGQFLPRRRHKMSANDRAGSKNAAGSTAQANDWAGPKDAAGSGPQATRMLAVPARHWDSRESESERREKKCGFNVGDEGNFTATPA